MIRVILALLKGAFGGIVVQAIRAMLEQFKNDPGYLDKLATLAAAKVAEVEKRYAGQQGAGDQKYSEVFAYLKDWVVAQGLQIATKTINFAIEAALLALPKE